MHILRQWCSVIMLHRTCESAWGCEVGWMGHAQYLAEIQYLTYVLGGSMHMLRQWCSLIMLHRTCEKVQGGVRLGGLDMLNILCMPF